MRELIRNHSASIKDCTVLGPGEVKPESIHKDGSCVSVFYCSAHTTRPSHRSAQTDEKNIRTLGEATDAVQELNDYRDSLGDAVRHCVVVVETTGLSDSQASELGEFIANVWMAEDLGVEAGDVINSGVVHKDE